MTPEVPDREVAESGPTTTPAPAGEEPGTSRAAPTPGKQRAGATRLSAAWTAVVVAVVILILLVIFIAENTQDSEVNYLGAHGHAPAAVVILIAALAGAVVVVVIGLGRIVQLRHRGRRMARGAGPATE